MKTTTMATALPAALTLTLALGLTACSTEEATEPSAPTAVEGTAAASSPEDDTEGTAAVPPPAEGEEGADLTARALQAVGTAEEDAGGTAYEIDDQDDDGSWEVDVRVEDRSVEVTVAADGVSVVDREEDDLDDDARAGLDQATITLAEAIELAIAEVGGVLDDAELDEDDGTHYWEVTLDGTDRGDDIEVKISVTGEVLEID